MACAMVISPGYWQIKNVMLKNNIFSVYFITVSVSFADNLKKKNEINKFNWVSGSPPMLYKLVLRPITIVHTNFWLYRHFKII